MSDINQISRNTRGDAVHTVVKSALSAIPVVGGTAAELFAAIVQPPIERRRDEWMQSVGEMLTELQMRGVNLEALQGDEQFIDTVLQATQVALRNHQEEKRVALRAAIANSALGSTPDDTLMHVFLRYVDEFSVQHLMILDLFADPPGWFACNGRSFPPLSMGGLSDIIEKAFPELKNSKNLYGQIWKDLYQRGLVNAEGLNMTMTGAGLRENRLTGLGTQFLSFIQMPEDA